MSLKKIDILLVGAGVMSATLGKLLAELDPSLKIMMVERLSKVAHESSHGLNNAGTGANKMWLFCVNGMTLYAPIICSKKWSTAKIMRSCANGCRW